MIRSLSDFVAGVTTTQALLSSPNTDLATEGHSETLAGNRAGIGDYISQSWV